MKRIAAFLFACLFSVLMLAACGSKESADGEYVAVKDDSGSITGYERKYHNDEGELTRWDVYTADEVYDHYILYEYDSDGRLGKETYYQADGIGVYYNAYSYNDDGVLMEMDYVNAKEGSERLIYDENGVEKERLTFDSSDNLIKYEVFRDGEWVSDEVPTEAEEATE